MQSAPPSLKQSWTVRVGEASVLGLGVAAFTAIPTALRTAGAGGGFFAGLVAGAAVLLPPVLLAILLARAAGRGFRAVTGATPRRVVVFGLALWIGISVPMLAVVARVLKVHTHHRGLGGTAFALAGIVIAVLAAAAAYRMVAVGQSLVARGVRPWIPAALGSAIGVVPLLLMAAPLAGRGGGPRAPEVRATLVDGAIVIVAIALVASLQIGDRIGRIAATWGVPLAAVVIIGGGAELGASPSLGHAVRAGGGLAATLLDVVQPPPQTDTSTRLDPGGVQQVRASGLSPRIL